MVQRILQPLEIESTDHVSIARLRLPERSEVFALRAQRLRKLSVDNPLGQAFGPYLALMAGVAEAQHAIAGTLELPMPSDAAIDRAQSHRMPILAAMDEEALAGWQPVAQRLIADLIAHGTLPPDALAALRALTPDTLDEQAQAILGMRDLPVDGMSAPFIMAALQLHRTVLASQLRESQVPTLDVATVCPCCGSLPVASVVRIGGRYQGLRYLQCGLCATEWHMVRVKCSHCESTEGISYHVVEEHHEALKAETCDQCHHYRKIVYMEKDATVEPLADDLASLALDVMMAEAGYGRASGNPLLWLGEGDDERGDEGSDADDADER
ncbi:formate dehydrogenase accessory protein FdhE [Cupriavidus plantarum]|uniref:Protein FdhE homolog n=1 Tax=Cupriavidus plantarum TaxID=942865 RepID=A0A316ER46_9BURK|nr:formate dehydrogenase accessory protein FdhE [Cupriavidus plantarum]NYI00567.1 FdhE protein [Cupriavidus plantarum]PWK34977.1 FdhE protein [Cupriavidus plantarum]CAG2136888.1 Protein FdhE [Cupriavidus plantarum]SMR84820.1 FdhE protein [Cupriavidus plantarum]